ncbi:MAG TPA: substrate-binding domain-containing protein, partial [Candidatus Eisenbacteria bacterium]|nr:substrate-binding domain-containing protein [Candidatus Eisenbacteria bacterium]
MLEASRGIGRQPLHHLAVALVAMMVAVACTTTAPSQAGGGTAAPSAAPAATIAPSATAAAGACAPVLPTGTGLAADLKGANGEDGVASSTVTLSDADLTAAKGVLGGKTVAIAQHIGVADYTRQVVGAASEILTAAGATIVTSDANFDPAKQISDIENLLSQKPALLIVFPVDQAATVPGIQAANRANVPVVVVGSALRDGGEYASLVTADNYEGGVIAAQQLVDLIGGSGEIAIVPYKFSLWHVDERVRGFRDGVKCSQIAVAEQGQTCTNENDCVGVFADILTAHPALTGGFGAYDGIGLGMNAAALTAGWSGTVVTHDLGLATAQAILGGTAPLKATAAQETLDQGVTAGRIAIKVLL